MSASSQPTSADRLREELCRPSTAYGRRGALPQLHILAARNDADAVKKILAPGTAPCDFSGLFRASGRVSMLEVAAEYGSDAVIAELLEFLELAKESGEVRGSEEEEWYSSRGVGGVEFYSALTLAAENGHVGTISLLLAKGGHLRIGATESKLQFQSVMLIALDCNHGKVAREILQRVPAPSDHDLGWSNAPAGALELAARNGDTETLVLAMKNGDTKTSQSADAVLAINLAAMLGDSAAVKLFLKAGVDPNAEAPATHGVGLLSVLEFLRSSFSWSDCLPRRIIDKFFGEGQWPIVPYAGAMLVGSDPIKELLLDHDAVPTAAKSVLFVAVARNDLKAARQCLNNFTMLLKGHDELKTILAGGLLFAVLAGNADMVRLFIQKGADPDQCLGGLLNGRQPPFAHVTVRPLESGVDDISPLDSMSNVGSSTTPTPSTTVNNHSPGDPFLLDWSLLMLAVGIREPDVAAALIDGGADVHATAGGIGDALLMLVTQTMDYPLSIQDRESSCFQDLWRGLSRGEAVRKFREICRLLIREGVDAHNVFLRNQNGHVASPQSVFSYVIKALGEFNSNFSRRGQRRWLREIVTEQRRCWAQVITPKLVFTVLLQSGVRISVSDLVPLVFKSSWFRRRGRSVWCLDTLPKYFKAVADRPDAVNLLLRLWMDIALIEGILKPYVVHGIGFVVNALWRSSWVADFDINGRKMSEDGRENHPLDPESLGRLPALAGGVISTFLGGGGFPARGGNEYANLLAILKLGATFPPRVQEPAQRLAEMAAHAQNVHGEFVNNVLHRHVAEAREVVGQPGELTEEKVREMVEGLTGGQVQEIRAAVPEAAGRSDDEIRDALQRSAGRVMQAGRSQEYPLTGSGAVNLVFARLGHDARERGGDVVENAFVPICQALLDSFCAYNGWGQESCTAGFVSRVLNLLQGRTMGAAECADGLPRTIDGYLKRLQTVRATNADSIHREVVARLLNVDRKKLNEIMDKLIDGIQVCFAKNMLRGLLFGELLREFGDLLAKIFLEDEHPQLTPGVENLLRNISEISDVFCEFLMGQGAYDNFLTVMRDLGIADGENKDATKGHAGEDLITGAGVGGDACDAGGKGEGAKE